MYFGNLLLDLESNEENSFFEELRVNRLSHPKLLHSVVEMLCSNEHLKDERKRKFAYHRRTDGDFDF